MLKSNASMYLCVTLAMVLSATTSSQIQPTGKRIGLVQFDAITHAYTYDFYSATILFSRYWVCPDFYALAIPWSEPNGRGFLRLRKHAVLSDRESYLWYDTRFTPTLKTYAKADSRPPFAWMAGIYHSRESRFADMAAIARRLFTGDFQSVVLRDPDSETAFDLNLTRADVTNGRKVSRIKGTRKGNILSSVELYDMQDQLLCKIRYEYDQDGAKLAKLIAELPPTPQKILLNARAIYRAQGSDSPGEGTVKIETADHIHHKGGRICTVIYKDIPLADHPVRLPVEVEVRRADDQTLLRRTTLMNFRLVQMDKDQVWQAATTYAAVSEEGRTLGRIVDRYLRYRARPGKPQVDPNDLDAVTKLIAKYPIPQMPPAPARKLPQPAFSPNEPVTVEALEKRWQELRNQEQQDRQAEREQIRQQKLEFQMWSEEFRRNRFTKEIEPNDARLIRQLIGHYAAVTYDFASKHPEVELIITDKEIDQQGQAIPDDVKRAVVLYGKLRNIPFYYREPTLPEDLPPQIEPNDLITIGRLTDHYNAIANDRSIGLAQRLEASNALTRIDLLLKDWARYYEHSLDYLELLEAPDLRAVYMDSGLQLLEGLLDAAQYQKANQFVRYWASKAGSLVDVNDILRFAYVKSRLGVYCPTLQVLDSLLRRQGLTPLQRYQALALRAIDLHMIDSLLATQDKSVEAISQWILTSTTRQQIARQVEPALRQAVAAWQALGPAKMDAARPYSTARLTPFAKYVLQPPDSTPLQETSAMLDQIVRQRIPQTDAGQPQQALPRGTRVPSRRAGR